MKDELLIVINVDRGRVWAAIKNKPAQNVKIIEFNIDTGVIRLTPNYVDELFVDDMAVLAKNSEDLTPMTVLPSLCKKCLDIIRTCMAQKDG